MRKPTFKFAQIVDPDLVLTEMSNANVCLKSPIAIGATVLEFAKFAMFKLAYCKFPEIERSVGCSITIVGGDTDSFFLEVVGRDF